MKNDRFESAKKLSLILSIILGVAFLIVGLAEIFLSLGDEWGKLHLCLFCLEGLLGMSIIFMGFNFSAITTKLSQIEAQLVDEDEKIDDGI